MGITLFNIKKWYLMLTGKSVLHVKQSLGKVISVSEIKGYYNDMTEKVLRQPELIGNESLPKVTSEKGEVIIFPVAIFQYGLGAYDLYLMTGDEKYKYKFAQCVDWAYSNQEPNGAWNNFFFYYPDHPYGSMAQAEGASLLIRANKCFSDDKYMLAAKKAIDFMLLPIEDGGTTEYCGEDVIFHEYTHRETVLNGWVFSLFGLFDYVISNKDSDYYRKVLNDSLNSLVKYIPEFNLSYWSGYDLCGRIASPFYHHLHIAQFRALYELTNNTEFLNVSTLWEKQEKNFFCKLRAFLIKTIQKITEKI